MVLCNDTDDICFLHQFVDTIIERPYWIRVAYATLMYTIFVVGVSGNLVTCVVIYCDRSMHTATNYYLFNLAVSDLIAAFGIFMEVYLLNSYSIEYDEYGDVVCRVHFFSVAALWNNSILTMTALAIERYIVIWHPLMLNRRPVWRRVMKIIVIIWSLAILEALPEIWTIRFIRAEAYAQCFIMPTIFAKWLNAVLGLVTFVIPLGIMIFVYTMVAFKVNITQNIYPGGAIFNHQNSSSKINKLIIALTLSFLVLWLPFFLLRVFIVVIDWIKTEYLLKHWDLVLMFTACSSWFNIVLNPLLFSVMSTKFRKAFKILWNTKFRMMDTMPRTQSLIV